MSRAARRPTRDLPPVFLGRDAVAEGVLTVKQLRGPLVRRVLQGVYRPAWTPLTHELKCHAAALVLPSGACITGRSCATVLGVRLARAEDPVEVCVPDGVPVQQRRGVVVREARQDLDAPRRVADLPLASSRRMAFDLAARWPLAEAVGHLDAVVRGELLDATSFITWLEDRRDNDVVAVRAAAELVDGRAESLPESRVRVVLTSAGFVVVPQFEIWADGVLVARVDLAIVSLRIAIEYDGVWHALREQLTRDRERLNRLSRAGWTVVHVTADMMRDPQAVVDAVRVAARRSQRLSA